MLLQKPYLIVKISSSLSTQTRVQHQHAVPFMQLLVDQKYTNVR